MTLDTSRQVAIAAIGIMTELVRKSKKSRNCIPITVEPSEAGERSRKIDSIKTRLFPAPVQLILEGGYGALGQGDGACDRRKQDEEKEQDPDCGPKSHARYHRES